MRGKSHSNYLEAINLIKTLVHRDLKIYSQSELYSEIEFVIRVLGDNDYPLDIEQSAVRYQYGTI